MIAPEGLDEDNLPWSKYGAYEEVPGVTTTTEETIAIDDYKGEANTAAIVSHYGLVLITQSVGVLITRSRMGQRVIWGPVVNGWNRLITKRR